MKLKPSKNQTQKVIYTVDDEDFARDEASVNVSTIMSVRTSKPVVKKQDPPITFTVETINGSKVQYEISDYKKGCGTCKSLKNSV